MDGGPNYPKTRESYRARGTEADWRYGIECPLALPKSCYQLDLVLNALWHYHTVPLSAGGIEGP